MDPTPAPPEDGVTPPATPAPDAGLSKAQERIAGLTRDRDGLSAKYAEAQKRIAELEEANSGNADLSKKIETLREQHKAAAAAWDNERMWLNSPIKDKPAQAAARAYYDSEPEDGRPPLSDWLNSLSEAEDAAERYPLLASYLGQPSQPRTPPKASQLPSTAPPAAGNVSDEARAALLEAARKTPNGSPEWHAFNAAVGYQRR